MWVICALLGKAPVILLDEPTSGMDPQARRDFWAMLKQIAQQEKRCVLFSTHYLEEADLLAQRKVIMAHGQVMCCGTSLELKKTWGSGYWLHVAADKGQTPEQAATNLKNLGTAVVQKATGGGNPIETRNRTTNEYYLSYCVPWDKTDRIPEVLDAVEASKRQFGVGSYSVEMTTMDDVFGKCGDEAEKKLGNQDEAAATVARSQIVEERQTTPLRPRNLGFHLRAMFFFRVADRFGSVSRSVNFFVTVAILGVLLYLVGFMRTDVPPPGRELTEKSGTETQQPAKSFVELRGGGSDQDSVPGLPAKVEKPAEVKNVFGISMIQMIFSFAVWPWFLGGYLLVVGGQSAKDIATGLRRHMYIHGLGPMAYGFGNIISNWPQALLVFITSAVFVSARLYPFTADSALLVPIFLIAVLGSLQAVLYALVLINSR